MAIGSSVQIIGQENTGEIIELNKNKAMVAFGELSSWVDIKKLTVVASTKKEEKKKFAAPSGLDMNAKMQHFNTDLNLIGTRGEDAVRQLQMYIDDAYLLGFKLVRIVHGRGYGILRKLIREQLKSNPFVDHFADEHMDMGGDAVTIVTLRV
jgi:DNA mismatch repair protein MutS2